MQHQVHIDLETLDTKHTAKILSIGAVCGQEQFYTEIALDHYPETGHFTISDSTVKWWDEQGGFQPSTVPQSPHEAVTSFVRWFDRQDIDSKKLEVWANSPSFDCAILHNHFNYYSVNHPWRFYHERDVRTIKSLATAMRLNIRPYKNPHNALEDAKNQQRFVNSVYQTLAQQCQTANELARS